MRNSAKHWTSNTEHWTVNTEWLSAVIIYVNQSLNMLIDMSCCWKQPIVMVKMKKKQKSLRNLIFVTDA